MVVATLVLEGSGTAVNAQLAQINAIAAQYGGLAAGPENGVRGYFLTYVIAYVLLVVVCCCCCLLLLLLLFVVVVCFTRRRR
jgi:hypothetical protein